MEVAKTKKWAENILKRRWDILGKKFQTVKEATPPLVSHGLLSLKL